MSVRNMSQLSKTIPKQPNLKPAEDFFHLRREGIQFIEQMASARWTDYNVHDPGVTILEALSYAITDLSYRTGWEVQDLLMPSAPPADQNEPFPRQAFFTARNILTVNPWTPDDFRRVLIDLPEIRNAWVFCKTCACDVLYYAWCEKDRLTLSFVKPAKQTSPPKAVSLGGFHEVLLELESDSEVGDPNDRKVEHRYRVFDEENRPHTAIVELRFLDWELERKDDLMVLIQSGGAFAGVNGSGFDLKLTQLGATKSYNVLTDADLDEADRDEYLRRHWQNGFHVSFEVTIQPGGSRIAIPSARLHILSDVFVRERGTVAGLLAILEDRTSSGVIQQYREKLLRIDLAIKRAKVTLHSCRNLAEDHCRVTGVEVEDVAVCADVEVRSDTDIEWVQARMWLEIERYLNPPISFYSLNELMKKETPVEEIFNGPMLKSGFLKTSELNAAGLRTELRTSDIVNLLMDIEGVVAVNNLMLSKYDREGNVVKGSADPSWANGNPVFDPDRVSAAWLLVIGAGHQPRLYRNRSRFLFYKNGLPFLPRLDEAHDTLIQLRGEFERPKLQGTQLDLPIPTGKFRDPAQYTPVQDGFPLTYGIGPSGLPSHASARRRAQAKQLKAYLMVFEQILGDALAQLAHMSDLFSLDPSVKQTYFGRAFNEANLRGYADITNGLDQARIDGLTETPPEFHERRNRFLDHLLARFGEQFGEYTMLLMNLEGKQRALDRLIADKIALLKVYPQISRDRARAFNYRQDPCSPENVSILKKRVSLLLGFPDLAWDWTSTKVGDNSYDTTFQLIDPNGTVWMEGGRALASMDPAAVRLNAYRTVIRRMILPNAYTIVSEDDKSRLVLLDAGGNALGRHPKLFDKAESARALRDELVAWSANDRAVIVEHLLLRPKFPGDALFPACTDGPCSTCGDEDPYSFRVTAVMPGWTAPFNANLELREFADRTIKQETPSHLLVKTCWVGNDGFVENPCEPVVGDVAELLVAKGKTNADEPPSERQACECASTLYRAFNTVFQRWYDDKVLQRMHAEVLEAALAHEFGTKIDPASISCASVLNAALWAEIQLIMAAHFRRVAMEGWQFERFEQAWCNWLEANAEWDWPEERLVDRVEAILQSNLLTDRNSKKPGKEELCQCAASIVAQYGSEFYAWMKVGIEAAIPLEEFAPFTPAPIMLCPGLSFRPGADALIEALLKDRYDAYTQVSYRLWILVELLAKLQNIYPGATLHDCDEGSDENPVRLGKTALGRYPLRRTLRDSGASEDITRLVRPTEPSKAPSREKPKRKTEKSTPRGKRKRRS